MGELLRQWGPPVLAWALFLTRRRSEDGARRCVRWVLLGLAVSLTALVPAVYAAIGRLTGDPDLGRLIGHGGMLFVAWAAQEFLARLTGLPRGPRWHARWVAGAFSVLCLLFALAPDLRPQSPWVLEYCVVYAAGQAPAFGNVVRLGLRYARAASDPALRAGLRLVAVGTTGALVYLVHKAVLTASARFDFPHPLGQTALVGKVLPVTAHLLVLLGTVTPALLHWSQRYRLYRQLRPLWHALYRADPAIALDPPAVADLLALRDLRLRLYRRVIEIRDGLLALQPYRDAGVADAARARAAGAGLRGQRLEAEVEAATVAAALRARALGTPPAEPEIRVAGGDDLDSDTAFLGRVARAYRAHSGGR
ncbi:MAB_1171c family putative transporter [Umezawaea beigongshangensis]|uniref:MAB_1171c family putative transporter n=1 Tax=Umezawaea beigongshangensis TaxID=2780383 RepID=UPI0018F1BF90|nr:MAB_1171c family putative transporter [Umezawaea beigongshangensis]